MSSQLIAIIPFQYTVRTQKTSPSAAQRVAFDMDPDTQLEITGTTTKNISIEYDEYISANYVYLNNLVADESWATNNHVMWTDAAGSGMTVSQLYYSSGDWIASIGVSGIQKTSVTDGNVQVLVKLIKDQEYRYNTRFITPSGYSMSVENIIIGEGFQLPPGWNQDYKIELSFQQGPYKNENLVGVKYPNYNSARENRLIERHTYNFTWDGSGAGTAYQTVFKNFFEAFGNTWQPFGLLWIDDSIINSSKSGLFIIDTDGVDISYNESMQEYSLSMTLIKLEKAS